MDGFTLSIEAVIVFISLHTCLLLAMIVWMFFSVKRGELDFTDALLSTLLTAIPIVQFFWLIYIFEDILVDFKRMRMEIHEKTEQRRRKKQHPHYEVLLYLRSVVSKYREVTQNMGYRAVDKQIDLLEKNYENPSVKMLVQESEEPFAYVMSLLKVNPELFNDEQSTTSVKTRILFEEFVEEAKEVNAKIIAKEKELAQEMRKKTEDRVEEELNQYIDFFKMKKERNRI